MGVEEVEGKEGEREEKRRGWTNLLTLELIEQNESCTETKRDRKAKGREENLMRGQEWGGGGGGGRVRRGETDTRGGRGGIMIMCTCVFGATKRRRRRRRHCALKGQMKLVPSGRSDCSFYRVTRHRSRRLPGESAEGLLTRSNFQYHQRRCSRCHY